MKTDGVFKIVKFNAVGHKFGEPFNIALFGDIHAESLGHDREKFVNFLAKAKENNCYAILNGDTFEALSGSERKAMLSGNYHESTLINQDISHLGSINALAELITKYIPPEKLIISTDCGFGRQGCDRAIAFFKTTAIAQGCNIVRQELGLETTHVPAANPALQTDIVPPGDE